MKQRYTHFSVKVCKHGLMENTKFIVVVVSLKGKVGNELGDRKKKKAGGGTLRCFQFSKNDKI